MHWMGPICWWIWVHAVWKNGSMSNTGLAMSFQNHPSTHSGVNWRPFWPSDHSFVKPNGPWLLSRLQCKSTDKFIGGLTAQRNVTRFPAHIRIHCVTPDAIMPVRIRIATVVLCQWDTSIGKICISVIGVRNMRCIRWPRLTLPARRCGTDGSSVSTTWLRYSTCCTASV